MLSEQTNFLGTLHIPKLSDDESLLCERELNESELYDTLKNVPNNRSLGNGELKNNFICLFWNRSSSIRTTSIEKKFSVLQKPTIIKLIEKKIKIKDLLKIGDPCHY